MCSSDLFPSHDTAAISIIGASLGGIPVSTTETAIGFIPCYRLPFLSLFHADCMEIMQQYPDKYFDLAIVDPPYGIGFDGNTTANGGIAGERNGFTHKQHHEKKNWDNERPSQEYFTELQRVSKNQIIWGGNYFADLLPASRGWIFWDKKITNVNNKNFSDGELAWTSFNCILRRFTYDWIGFGYFFYLVIYYVYFVCIYLSLGFIFGEHFFYEIIPCLN